MLCRRADRVVVQELIRMLDACNPLVQKFRLARDRLLESGATSVAIKFYGDEGGSHGTRYSGPTMSEVAALVVGDLTPEVARFDIVVKAENGPLQHVSPLNANVMSLQYPLLFPYGDKAFYLGIKRYSDYAGVLLLLLSLSSG